MGVGGIDGDRVLHDSGSQSGAPVLLSWVIVDFGATNYGDVVPVAFRKLPGGGVSGSL